MKEAAESRVELKDVTPGTVQLMLRFGYGDQQALADAEDLEMVQLYHLADRLQMKELQDYCRERMGSSTRVGSLAVLAHTYSDDQLQEICVKRAAEATDKTALLREVLNDTFGSPAGVQVAEKLILAAGFDGKPDERVSKKLKTSR